MTCNQGRAIVSLATILVPCRVPRLRYVAWIGSARATTRKRLRGCTCSLHRTLYYFYYYYSSSAAPVLLLLQNTAILLIILCIHPDFLVIIPVHDYKLLCKEKECVWLSSTVYIILLAFVEKEKWTSKEEIEREMDE